MRQLLLFRHAKSSWDEPHLSDHARPINARGRQAAALMRTRMHELGLFPDLVLVSSSRRTLQTMAALEPWDDSPLIEPMDALYLASAAQLFSVLNGIVETVRSAMVIGHNPGLHDLAVLLAGGSGDSATRRRVVEGFPTASLAEFSVTSPWGGLTGDGARLMRFLTPADGPDGVAGLSDTLD